MLDVWQMGGKPYRPHAVCIFRGIIRCIVRPNDIVFRHRVAFSSFVIKNELLRVL